MRQRLVLAFLSAFLGSVGGAVEAQPVISVDELRTGFDTRFKNEEVALRGWVSAERRVTSSSFKGYYLKDRYGSLLLVRTTRALPAINAQLTVSGVALRDADSGDVYIAETRRGVADQASTGEVRPEVRQRPVETATDKRLRELRGSIAAAIDAGQWSKAEGEIVELLGLDAEDSQAPAWRGQIEEGRERERQVNEIKNGISTAVSARNWPTADGLLAQLAVLAPGDAQARPWQQEVASGKREDAEAARRRQLLLIGGIALAALLVGGGLWLLSRRSEPVPMAVAAGPVSGLGGVVAGTAPAAAPAATSGPTVKRDTTRTLVDDYKTVRVYKTTKVMPGRLVVLEDGRETDVLHLYDQSGRGEVEIGRDSPDASGGIRIKDKTNTVSRRQARLTYSGGEFQLVNLAGAASNPTSLNGHEMSDRQEVVLKDGDTLVMGAVTLRFRKK